MFSCVLIDYFVKRFSSLINSFIQFRICDFFLTTISRGQKYRKDVFFHVFHRSVYRKCVFYIVILKKFLPLPSATTDINNSLAQFRIFDFFFLPLVKDKFTGWYFRVFRRSVCRKYVLYSYLK